VAETSSSRKATTMAMENFTRHQQGIIRSYYQNRDTVSFQRVQELLTDIYLAEGKKKEKLWDSMFNHLEKLGVPADQINHIKTKRDPELIAQIIQKKI
jgi:hypothetical protein